MSKKPNNDDALELLSVLVRKIREDVKEEAVDQAEQTLGKFLHETSLPLLIKRQVLLIGNIDSQMGEEVSRQIILLSTNVTFPINLFINSYGGDTETALQICDVINDTEARVDGTVIGNAHSAALLVLQACHRRKAYPHATILLHGHTIPFPADSNKFTTSLRLGRKEHNECLKKIAKKSGNSFERLRALSGENKILSAQQAKEWGLIDEIVERVRR